MSGKHVTRWTGKSAPKQTRPIQSPLSSVIFHKNLAHVILLIGDRCRQLNILRMEFETRDYRRRRVRHDRVNAVRGAAWGVALAAREFRKSPHRPCAGVTAIGPLDAIQRRQADTERRLRMTVDAEASCQESSFFSDRVSLGAECCSSALVARWRLSLLTSCGSIAFDRPKSFWGSGSDSLIRQWWSARWRDPRYSLAA